MDLKEGQVAAGFVNTVIEILIAINFGVLKNDKYNDSLRADRM
jgi:hypothetical protein